VRFASAAGAALLSSIHLCSGYSFKLTHSASEGEGEKSALTTYGIITGRGLVRHAI